MTRGCWPHFVPELSFLNLMFQRRTLGPAWPYFSLSWFQYGTVTLNLLFPSYLNGAPSRHVQVDGFVAYSEASTSRVLFLPNHRHHTTHISVLIPYLAKGKPNVGQM